jgi:uncharacterized protein YabE (DUF348 family)
MEANKQQQTKRSLKKIKFHHLRHPFMVPVIVFFVLFFFSIVLFISESGQTVGASDSRLVELTMNGSTKVIPTTSPTVGDLLNRLNITLNKGDVVEPSTDTSILENNFQINIYRVHPVTVVSNGQKTVIATADNDPKQIAKDAGYTIYPQDYVTAVANADNLGQGVLGQEVQVNPATPVNLNLYGSQVTERTHAKTVADLLSEDKIKTSAGNNVLPALNTPITPNLQVLVVPVGQKLISTQQVVPFATQTTDDPTIPYGQTQVVQAGANGLQLVVEEINSAGVVSGQLQQVVISQPVNQIVKHGTGVAAIAGGNNITWLKSSNININDYSYVNVIMTRETHWNPDDVNSSGCIGLGQSCGSPPGLAIVCPAWQVDAVCQLNFFNSYAMNHWGSWAAAAAHSNAYGWW